MAAENVAVGDALLGDRILQGAGDVFLADYVGEFLRTIFAGQDLIAHRNLRLYRGAASCERRANSRRNAPSSQPEPRSSKPARLRGLGWRGTLINCVLDGIFYY